ncbi:Uncharacterised protein [Streptococcus criceti]|uniref:Uncharacterized protein n=1 Tax=Streptococcus criceti HS-6 TaxID=873449 RepID=G5JNW5_STRCG|nr:hypothetical protein [Streptococcus criceti]EHI74596.1 hypothetical protein STRCR_1496 [Streptococcus criceti HS-6]SUN43377.1 Uncharacterised protein [Streptococcus criceti]
MRIIRRHWKLTLILLFVTLSFGLYKGYNAYQDYQRDKTKDYYSKFLSYISPQKIDSSAFLDAKTVALSWKNTDTKADHYIPSDSIDESGINQSSSNYIVKEKQRLRDKVQFGGIGNDYYTRNTLEKGEYWSVMVYKIGKNQIHDPVEINIPKTVRKYYPDYYPNFVQVFERRGKSYLGISAYKHKKTNSDKEWSYDSIEINISLDTQKIVSEQELGTPSPFSPVGSFYYETNLQDKLRKQGVTFHGNGLYLTKKGMKNSKQWQIAKKYPKVYKILKNGGSLYLMQDKTDMEYTAKILQLFAPKGTDIFDGTKIPANYSIDGQEHTVHSYEEFKKYYKTEGME